jgi:hypothetical protein
MKHIVNITCGTAAIAGLILAGAECQNLAVQVFTGIGGAMLFAAGCFGICHFNREG